MGVGVFIAGPPLGALVGLILGEALIGELGQDGGHLMTLGLVVALGTLLGGPVLSLLATRLDRRRRTVAEG